MIPPGTPTLLNQDGSASMATALMMSHHAFRRDIAQFGRALQGLAAGDQTKVSALREEWQFYRGALHGHHMMEDQNIFPDVKKKSASLAPVIEQLTSDHRRIDPVLEQGDHALAGLPGTLDAAVAVVTELSALLAPHLATEETHVVPLLRDAKAFPPPTTDAEAEMYAMGFAWSSHGVAQDVLDCVYGMLPEILTSRLPAARSAFAQRCERVWGSAAAGASRTPIPDWITSD